MAQSLPYENATSGERALADMQRTLSKFGCQSFGNMIDFEKEVVIVQFRFHDRQIHIEASIRGYAAAWLRAHPWSRRVSNTKIDHERRAKDIASKAVYSMLRDWLKGQLTAVEVGMLSFEGAFLGQMMLPSGVTVLQHLESTNLLPKLSEGAS